MGSIENISELCRLCLISDQVNVPIFDENPTKEQTFVKINSCLPVKVSRDDSLPKKICDGCSYKLDMCYTFRNASVEAEKQLLELLNQAGLSACTDLMSSDPLASTKAEIMVKQETFEPIDARGDGDTSDMGLDSHNYMMQQQKLAYPQDFDYAEASGSATDVMTDEPAPKRAKRAAALNKAPVETDDDDLDAVMDISKVTKAEDEDSEDVDQPEYAEVPSTSADEQPGPSGVGKAAAEAPSDCKKMAQANDFTCTICFKKYPSNSGLRHHNLLKHREKKYKCNFCGKMFAVFSLLKQHVRISHEKFPKFACELCNYETPEKSRLKVHIAIHHTKQFPLKCDVCNKGYIRSDDLQAHKEVHHEGLSLVCQFCSKVFRSHKYFKSHLKLHDPLSDGNKAACPQCSKTVYKYRLKQHMETHKEDRQGFVCDICGKNIASLGCMRVHKKIHKGEKNHVCDTCGKAFLTTVNLRTHIRVHTKEKPYKCKECDKAFSQKICLKNHMRYHTGERFKCGNCSKEYVTPSGLKGHKCTKKKS